MYTKAKINQALWFQDSLRWGRLETIYICEQVSCAATHLSAFTVRTCIACLLDPAKVLDAFSRPPLFNPAPPAYLMQQCTWAYRNDQVGRRHLFTTLTVSLKHGNKYRGQPKCVET